METMAHCAVHRKRPVEYMCPSCDNFPLCEECKQEHANDTRHAPENCKEVGLAIMHLYIQNANGRQAKELTERLGNILRELKTELLREIDRFQESRMQTEALRKMQKLDSEGRYAELYVYAKGLPTGEAKNKAAIEELSRCLHETLDKASNGLKKALCKVAKVAQYKAVFAAYKKEEILMLEGESCKNEEKIVSTLHSADMSTKFKAVYIDSLFTVGDYVASELASRLQAHPVSALYLNGCHISDAGAKVLAQAAFRGKSLSSFCIVSSEISGTGAKAVAEAARNSRSLTTFYINGTMISDSEAKAVAEAVKGCPLSVFYLASAGITNAGAISVAEVVKSCPLSAFCLESFEMSNAGAISVTKTMKDCPLSVFYLASDKISDSGATTIAEMLSSGGCAGTLSALCLESGRISDLGIKKVADAIRGCTKLSAFYIESKPISGEAVAYILADMADTSTIRSVNLCIGEISKKQMDPCLNRIQQSGAAKQLKLRFRCGTKAAWSVCEKFEAEWNAKLAEFRVVPSIAGLFTDEVILGVPK